MKAMMIAGLMVAVVGVATLAARHVPAQGQVRADGAAKGATAPAAAVEWVVTRAQPSVFRIETSCDFDVDVPRSITVRRDKLKQAYAKYHDAGGRDDERLYCWEQFIADPGAYLEPSQETQRFSFKDQPYCTGSGFAISREGILLTNAHVIGNPDTDELLRDATSATLVLDEPVRQKLQAPLVEAMDEVPADLGPAAYLAAVKWMAHHCQVHGRFSSAKVDLKFGTTVERLGDLRRELLAPHAITAPAEVLARGEVYPGKDVAVLKVYFNDQLRQLVLQNRDLSPRVRQDQLDEIQNDRLICLPLGSWVDVQPGTRVQALGFPGIGFDEKAMDVAALYRVDAQDGQIAQVRQMRAGWDGLEMTANINSGDSGGPVVDSRGVVVGINVASPDVASHSIAVSIDVAKELLGRLGIKPDVGPLTEHWHKAIDHYAAGRYAEAEQELETCKRMQVHALGRGGELVDTMQGSPTVSPAVEDLLFRCVVKEGKAGASDRAGAKEQVR